MKLSAFVLATVISTTQAFVPAIMSRASITRRSVVSDPTETTINNTAAKKVEPKAPTTAAPVTSAAPQPIEVDTKEVFFLNVESSANSGPLQPYVCNACLAIAICVVHRTFSLTTSSLFFFQQWSIQLVEVFQGLALL